ncbi:HAD family hydrolase [Candidatus Margulisiibacteriota bacterium]
MNTISINPKAKALIFDLDGTLVDSMPCHFQSWREVFFSLTGIDYPITLFNELAGIPTDKIVPIINKRLNTKIDPSQFDHLKKELFKNMINQIEVVNPVANLVYENFGKLPMAVGTGGRTEIVDLTLKATNLKQYFDIIITADDVKNYKPHPETFLLCAKKMQVKPEHCQVFEDSYLGMEAAKKANMIATFVG